MVKVEGADITVSKLVQNRQSNELILNNKLIQDIS